MPRPLILAALFTVPSTDAERCTAGRVPEVHTVHRSPVVADWQQPQLDAVDYLLRS
jgi:hypothetical protein